MIALRASLIRRFDPFFNKHIPTRLASVLPVRVSTGGAIRLAGVALGTTWLIVTRLPTHNHPWASIFGTVLVLLLTEVFTLAPTIVATALEVYFGAKVTGAALDFFGLTFEVSSPYRAEDNVEHPWEWLESNTLANLLCLFLLVTLFMIPTLGHRLALIYTLCVSASVVSGWTRKSFSSSLLEDAYRDDEETSYDVDALSLRVR